MKKILIVGLCYADAKKLSFELRKLFDLEITDLAKSDEAKEHLKNKGSPDMIIVNRIIHGDKRKGIDFLDYLREENIAVPTLFFSRFEDAQQEALKHGATDSFDMDLIIGYVSHSKKEKQKKAIEFLKKYLS
jgi:hypothetical protein